MCGIVGFNFSDKELVKKMCDVIIHRGPDDSDYYTDDFVSLGHRRLSIIDLSKNGRQPMSNQDGSMYITFNGEIYNHADIRKQLEKKGYQFKSNTDTEVIVNAYQEYGESCLSLFHGMFAFVIWDTTKREFFCARDRVGIKPFYYHHDKDKFFFASEIKSLLQYEEIKRNPSKQDLLDFLSYRYIPGNGTMFANVKKLLPGHYLKVKLSQENKISSFETTKYWDIDLETKKDTKENYYNSFKKHFDQSINWRLMSDVPLGVFLSGGIDSTTILASMKKFVTNPIETFTVGYNLPNFQDEIKPAQEISDFYNTSHNELLIEKNPLNDFPDIMWHLDEPVADPTVIPIYHLSKFAKQKVSVVLLGEGADEQCAGYEHYKIIKLGNQYANKLPKVFRKKVIPKVYDMVPKTVVNKFFKYAESLGEEGKKRFFKFLKHTDDVEESYYTINSIFTDKEKNEVLNFNTDDLEHSKRFVDEHYPNQTLTNSLLYLDNKMFLQHLLCKTDKMSMAGSIETRVPFLESDLVSFLGSVPDNMKLRGMQDKHILRKSFSSRLPDFIKNKKKQRFFVPVHHWIEDSDYVNYQEILSNSQLVKKNIINQKYLDKVFSRYHNSKLYYGRQLWSLLNMDMWYKVYIQDNSYKKPNKSISSYV